MATLIKNQSTYHKFALKFEKIRVNGSTRKNAGWPVLKAGRKGAGRNGLWDKKNGLRVGPQPANVGRAAPFRPVDKPLFRERVQ